MADAIFASRQPTCEALGAIRGRLWIQVRALNLYARIVHQRAPCNLIRSDIMAPAGLAGHTQKTLARSVSAHPESKLILTTTMYEQVDRGGSRSFVSITGR
jgi:hypothetical protein